MKAAPFDYLRPATVDEAVAALADAGEDGKVLAGGQSLVPVLAMRLGRPALLVDINAVEGLAGLSLTAGSLDIGATVRQRHVERDPAATAAVPLLGLALPWVGHRELRTRGTVCGSLAHADPAAELPAVAVLLDATLDLAGPAARRTVRARDFFTAPMTTLLAPDELLLAAHFPVTTPGDGFAFAELSRRHGDFPLAGVAIHVRQHPHGPTATLSAFGISSRPQFRDVTPHLAAALESTPPDSEPALVRALTLPMSALADELVDTPGDMHASTAYRRRLFTVLAARELARAHLRAQADLARETPGVRPSPGVSRASSAAPAPAPTTVPATDRATTKMTVNGKPVIVEATPRVTLADALRDHLHLTGTHLGCEHGICGMCTVLVNGQAARSCLLFACQLDGAEVTTVEGLGRPGELHPLQREFGRHHALQCGFCTPGFLLSAYDLLTHKPEVTEDELAAELAGVLCRCTGYRNILAAVAEVARTHPHGLPAPLNCAPR